MCVFFSRGIVSNNANLLRSTQMLTWHAVIVSTFFLYGCVPAWFGGGGLFSRRVKARTSVLWGLKVGASFACPLSLSSVVGSPKAYSLTGEVNGTVCAARYSESWQ